MPEPGERKVKNGILGEFDGTTWRRIASPGDTKVKDGVTAEWDGTTWRRVNAAVQARPNDPSKLPTRPETTEMHRDPNVPTGPLDYLKQMAGGAVDSVVGGAKGFVQHVAGTAPPALTFEDTQLGGVVNAPARIASAINTDDPGLAGREIVEAAMLAPVGKAVIPTKVPGFVTELPGKVSRGTSAAASAFARHPVADAVVGGTVGGLIAGPVGAIQGAVGLGAGGIMARFHRGWAGKPTFAEEMGLTAPGAVAGREAAAVQGSGRPAAVPTRTALDLDRGRSSAPPAVASPSDDLLSPMASHARAVNGVEGVGPSVLDIGRTRGGGPLATPPPPPNPNAGGVLSSPVDDALARELVRRANQRSSPVAEAVGEMANPPVMSTTLGRANPDGGGATVPVAPASYSAKRTGQPAEVGPLPEAPKPAVPTPAPPKAAPAKTAAPTQAPTAAPTQAATVSTPDSSPGVRVYHGSAEIARRGGRVDALRLDLDAAGRPRNVGDTMDSMGTWWTSEADDAAYYGRHIAEDGVTRNPGAVLEGRVALKNPRVFASPEEFRKFVEQFRGKGEMRTAPSGRDIRAALADHDGLIVKQGGVGDRTPKGGDFYLSFDNKGVTMPGPSKVVKTPVDPKTVPGIPGSRSRAARRDGAISPNDKKAYGEARAAGMTEAQADAEMLRQRAARAAANYAREKAAADARKAAKK